MEGSRHEKAALISVSYFIGAVTVFIGFYTVHSTDIPVSYSSPQVASVISANTATEKTTTPSALDSNSEYYGNVTYHNGILAIETITGKKIISYNPKLSGLDVESEFIEQGIHTGNIIYSVAPGDQYIFFCEEKDIVGSCTPYIYDTTSEKVYRVKVDSSEVQFTTDQARTVLWNMDGLHIFGLIQVDKSKPWLRLSSSLR